MLTRKECIDLKKRQEYNIQDMWEFYQNAEHELPKVDYETYLKLIPHYVNQGSMAAYDRYYNNLYNVMYLNHNGVSLVY